jgi:hypothetical protein
MKTRIALVTAILAAASLAGCVEDTGSTGAPAAGTQSGDALIGSLGLACKNRVIEQFGAISSDVSVSMGATAGNMSAAELRAQGASFSWSVAGRNASGYCNVDGSGRIVEFVQY